MPQMARTLWLTALIISSEASASVKRNSKAPKAREITPAAHSNQIPAGLYTSNYSTGSQTHVYVSISNNMPYKNLKKYLWLQF
jgi:hypothetical protein